MQSHQRTPKSSRARQAALVWGPLLAIVALASCGQLPTGEAFCNCLGGPMSMFKLGKQSPGGAYASQSMGSVYGPQVVHPGERAGWYAQSQHQQQPYYGQQSSIK